MVSGHVECEISIRLSQDWVVPRASNAGGENIYLNAGDAAEVIPDLEGPRRAAQGLA